MLFYQRINFKVDENKQKPSEAVMI